MKAPRAFTLIEVAAVMAVLALMAALTAVRLSGASASATAGAAATVQDAQHRLMSLDQRARRSAQSVGLAGGHGGRPSAIWLTINPAQGQAVWSRRDGFGRNDIELGRVEIGVGSGAQGRGCRVWTQQHGGWTDQAVDLPVTARGTPDYAVWWDGMPSESETARTTHLSTTAYPGLPGLPGVAVVGVTGQGVPVASPDEAEEVLDARP